MDSGMRAALADGPTLRQETALSNQWPGHRVSHSREQDVGHGEMGSPGPSVVWKQALVTNRPTELQKYSSPVEATNTPIPWTTAPGVWISPLRTSGPGPIRVGVQNLQLTTRYLTYDFFQAPNLPLVYIFQPYPRACIRQSCRSQPTRRRPPTCMPRSARIGHAPGSQPASLVANGAWLSKR